MPASPPMAVLNELPALVVLDRLPVPVLAIAEDGGAIVFANSAFADMLGYPAEAVGGAEVPRDLSHHARRRVGGLGHARAREPHR